MDKEKSKKAKKKLYEAIELMEGCNAPEAVDFVNTFERVYGKSVAICVCSIIDSDNPPEMAYEFYEHCMEDVKVTTRMLCDTGLSALELPNPFKKTSINEETMKAILAEIEGMGRADSATD